MKIRSRRELVPLDDSVESFVSIKYRRALRLSLTPEESYSREELESILAEETARLKPNLQRALGVYVMEGVKARDAAKVLGISNSALKGRVHQARLALRLRLNRRGVGPRQDPKRSPAGFRGFAPRRRNFRMLMATRHYSDFGD